VAKDPFTVDYDDPNLTLQEEWLIRCAEKGEWWEYTGAPDNPISSDPWDTSRVLRASVIRALAAGDVWPTRLAPWRVGPSGLMVQGAWIRGELNLDGATVGQILGLHDCAFEAAVTLMDAKLKTVSLHGSHLPRLTAERSTIEGTLFLSDGFSTRGEVILRGATIENQLACVNGTFDNPGGTALGCDALSVGADVLLRGGFSANGEVSFVRATIKGQFSCSNGSFDNPDDRALTCDTLSVGTDVFLSGGFSAKGEVDFANARIGSNLYLQRATLDNPSGDALDLMLAQIGAGLFVRALKPPSGSNTGMNGRLVLTQARCRTYCDDTSSWPEKGKLALDGFIYERFDDCDTDFEARTTWLSLQDRHHLDSKFRPQPWIQAIKVLRDMGHDRDARNLGIEFEKARALRPSVRWYWKLWHYFTFFTVGCGYKPEWAGVWSAVFILFGWLTFATAANLGFMTPRDGSVVAYLAANPKAPLPEDYTRFNALVFAMDAYLPVIELGQDLSWEPSVAQRGGLRPLEAGEGWFTCAKRLLSGQNAVWKSRPAPHGTCGDANGGLVLGRATAMAEWLFRHGFHRLVYWLDEILGWTFISLFIAGMSGLMKKE